MYIGLDFRSAGGRVKIAILLTRVGHVKTCQERYSWQGQ